MNNHTKNKLKSMLEKPWLANTAALCIAIVFWYCLQSLPALSKGISYIVSTISSILIGVVIAYLINPVCVFIENRILGNMKNRNHAQTISVALAILLAVLLFVLFMILLIPSLLDSVNMLIGNISVYVRSADQWIDKIESMAAVYGINLSGIADQASDMIDNMIKGLPGYLTDFVTGSFKFGSSMVSWVIAVIFAVYFLTGKKGILEALQKFRHTVLREETVRKHDIFLTHCHHIMTNYVGYTLLDALIVGLANAVFMLVCGIPYVGLISVVVALTNLVPTFGPAIGAVIGGFLLVLHNPMQALWFIIFTMVLQTIDGYVIKPKLFSGSLGVPSVLVLISVVIGGELFGIAGIILAIPFAAIITYIYNDLIMPALERRKKRIEGAAKE